MIEALGELSEDLDPEIWAELISEFSMSDPQSVITGIINKIQNSLPESLDDVYDHLVTAAGVANAQLYLLSEMLGGDVEGLSYNAEYATKGIETMTETIKEKFDLIQILGVGVFSAMSCS